MKVVLLGDSIFDNKIYVQAHEPDVREQLQNLLPHGRVVLLATDGSQTKDISRQLRHLPDQSTHLVLSMGGNDLLQHYNLLSHPTHTIMDALSTLAKVKQDFQDQYEAMLGQVLSYRLPTTVCTIYYPNYEEDFLQQAAKIALAPFNDVVMTTAIRHHLPLIDLRLVCRERQDYANPIEPSALGGAKIAQTIAKVLQEHPFDQPRTRVYWI